MLSLFSVIREISCYEERGGMQRKANSAATTVVCYNYVHTFMYELSRKQFVFFFVFSLSLQKKAIRLNNQGKNYDC